MWVQVCCTFCSVRRREIKRRCNTKVFFFLLSNKFTMQVSSVASLKNDRIGNFCPCWVFLLLQVKESLLYFYPLRDLLFWAKAVVFLMTAGERGGTTLNASSLSMPGALCSTALHGMWPNHVLLITYFYVPNQSRSMLILFSWRCRRGAVSALFQG